MLSTTRTWAEPLLAAHENLLGILGNAGQIDDLRKTYLSSYGFFNLPTDVQWDDGTILGLCSSALILDWLSARLCRSVDESGSLSDAEEWVLGSRPASGMLSARLCGEAQSQILQPLRSLEYGSSFLEMLPYAAEVFITSDEILNAFGVSRITKRRSGIFYTPSDVSDYIVRHSYRAALSTHTGRDFTWLDPACGSGVFLLSAVRMLFDTLHLCPGEDALGHVADCIFGIDINPVALQSALYALVLSCVVEQAEMDRPPIEWLHTIGHNLVPFDSTAIRDTLALSRLLPRLACGADIVVSNPPYAKSMAYQAQLSLGLAETKARDAEGNLYVRFVRLMRSLSHPDLGVGGMVVPLSIAFSTRREFTELRRFMRSDATIWRLAHFDRTPDSLFGDDVKTRNTVVFYTAAPTSPNQIYTTDLMRWNSRARDDLFAGIEFCPVSSELLQDVIPKVEAGIAHEILLEMYKRRLPGIGGILATVQEGSCAPDQTLRSANTAYNWLPFELLVGLPEGAAAHNTSNRYRYWRAESPDLSLMAFAVLQSRLAYWMWRVWGDGFHLTDQFVGALPIGPQSFNNDSKLTLAALAKELWSDMLNHGVESVNAGRRTQSFCPHYSEGILDSIDGILIRELRLPTGAGSYLKEYVRRTVVAGRMGEIGPNRALPDWLVMEY